MIHLEKALLYLVFQAAMLMIDKTFKGTKSICLLLARLIGHTYIHLQRSVCFPARVSLGLSQDVWFREEYQFTGCCTENFSHLIGN